MQTNGFTGTNTFSSWTSNGGLDSNVATTAVKARKGRKRKEAEIRTLVPQLNPSKPDLGIVSRTRRNSVNAGVERRSDPRASERG
jgi:hypothetical protein